jgi:hypothetical protein
MASREHVVGFYGCCMIYCKKYMHLGKFMQGTNFLPYLVGWGSKKWQSGGCGGWHTTNNVTMLGSWKNSEF